MTKCFAVLLLTLSSAFYSTLLAESKFVHTDGRNLVSPDGSPLHLKGTNLGNWLEQEGYMFHFDDGPQSPREIEDLANQLLGPEEAAQYWQQYRDNYITEPDIKFLHDTGMNSPFLSYLPAVLRSIGWVRRSWPYMILERK